MEGKMWLVVFVALAPTIIEAWDSAERIPSRGLRRGQMVHYHSKRHMLPSPDNEAKRRINAQREREHRKPSGHLQPLQEDDMDNDEVVSVAIGPPPMRPKYEKVNRKNSRNPTTTAAPNITVETQASATDMVKDVFAQLGRELLTHKVNEEFVFGQYIGISMKNLTSELKLKMQHEILELIVKYQKINRGETSQLKLDVPNSLSFMLEKKETKKNETEEAWPDFSNLAKIVG